MRYVRWFLMALVVIAVAGGLTYGYYRTLLSEGSPKQDAFVKGTFPSPLPGGLLKGSVDGLQVSWKGKKLNADHQSGINVFAGDNGEEERYPFKTYQAKGLRDPGLDVLRIDYDLPGNPSGFGASPMRSSKWRKEHTWAKCTSVSCPAIPSPWATLGLNGRTTAPQHTHRHSPSASISTL